MKKVFVLSLLFVSAPASAIIVTDWTGQCGAYKYDVVYARFEPNSYVCNVNTYLPRQATTCAACPSGFDCDGGTFTFSETNDQGLTPHTVTCQSGYFLPAASESCVACPSGYTCPGGTFDVNQTEFQGLAKSATYMAGNEVGVCAANYAHRIYAVFTPIPYVCASGQFLPAASTACAACPSGYTCAGGTYYYHKTNAQGLTRVDQKYTTNEVKACAANFAHNLIATFEPNVITVIWDGADPEDVAANNAGTITYDGDIRTPKKAQHINGKVFVGWKFDDPNAN